MLTKTTAALAAALIVGSASVALASSDNSGEYHGGFVVPGDPAVNPAYHPGWFPNYPRGGNAYGSAPTVKHRPIVLQQDGTR
jgi:hypothetical protein